MPQHRGGQSALAEPKIDTIEQYSKVGSMDFHWIGFGAPQPLERVSTPPPLEDSANSESSSSSSSSESDTPQEETVTSKKKQSTSKPRTSYSQICCGVAHFGVGHAMIPDDSEQDSSLLTLARSPMEICMRPSIVKDDSDAGHFTDESDPGFSQSPRLPTCLGIHV